MRARQTETFKYNTFTDPLTERTITQLTNGHGFSYPLYYFGPVATADGAMVIFYRYRQGEVQNWKLELDSGTATRLTDATTQNCLWRFWDEPETAQGVRDQMSAFSTVSEEMTYFDGNQLRTVHVHTLEDRLVYTLADHRVPCGIPGLSPSGRRFVFMHADRGWWNEATGKGTPARHEAKGVHLDVIDMKTGEHRNLLVINTWLTHANFYDEDRILFAQLPTENSTLLTDLRGGWFACLRTQTADGIVINHSVPTARGVRYETVSPFPQGVIGQIDPDSFQATDYRTDYPIHHVGQDWEGRLWFADIYEPEPPHPHHLAWLPSVNPGEVNTFSMLTQGFQTYDRPKCQRSHLHPTLMPDRQHILFTGPDHESRTNHLFLIDVSDLANRETRIVER